MILLTYIHIQYVSFVFYLVYLYICIYIFSSLIKQKKIFITLIMFSASFLFNYPLIYLLFLCDMSPCSNVKKKSHAFIFLSSNVYSLSFQSSFTILMLIKFKVIIHSIDTIPKVCRVCPDSNNMYNIVWN